MALEIRDRGDRGTAARAAPPRSALLFTGGSGPAKSSWPLVRNPGRTWLAVHVPGSGHCIRSLQPALCSATHRGGFWFRGPEVHRSIVDAWCLESRDFFSSDHPAIVGGRD